MSNQTRSEFESHLKSALELNLPYSNRLIIPESSSAIKTVAISASVLVLIAFSNSADCLNKAALLFIKRTEWMQKHRGQIAFPGGVGKPGEEPITTALRETQEEVGITPESVKIIGRLPSILTMTEYVINPFVGLLETKLEEAHLILDPFEIAESLWVPFCILMNSSTYRTEVILHHHLEYPIHVYQVQHHRIWGATASMTKNLLDRLNAPMRNKNEL